MHETPLLEQMILGVSTTEPFIIARVAYASLLVCKKIRNDVTEAESATMRPAIKWNQVRHMGS